MGSDGTRQWLQFALAAFLAAGSGYGAFTRLDAGLSALDARFMVLEGAGDKRASRIDGLHDELDSLERECAIRGNRLSTAERELEQLRRDFVGLQEESRRERIYYQQMISPAVRDIQSIMRRNGGKMP